jgi:hypothetical protein
LKSERYARVVKGVKGYYLQKYIVREYIFSKILNYFNFPRSGLSSLKDSFASSVEF